MQISVRAAAVRAALERATGEVATATAAASGVLRISVPAPASATDEQWTTILRALKGATQWGCTDGAGRTTVWAEIQEEM